MFSASVINEYHQLMLGEKAYSFQTVNQSVNAIKLYYQGYLKREFELQDVIRPKTGRQLPKVWNKEEMRKILKTSDYYKEFKPKEYLFLGQFGGKYSATSAGNVLSKAYRKERRTQTRWITLITT